MKKRNKKYSYKINIFIDVTAVYWISIIVSFIPSHHIY